MEEKVVTLFSGGIDSPLAAMRASRRFEILPLYFCIYPMISEENSLRAIESLRKLREKMDFERAIIFPWAGILSEIKKSVAEGYSCVACRRGMLEIASKIGKQEGVSGIITGESLGQKASQTIENISATSSGIDLPVMRPLIGMNKEEITSLARRRDIYMEKHAGCCLATPRKPRTKAKKDVVEKEMEKIELERLIDDSKDLMLKIKDLDRDFEDYLLRLAAEFG